MLKRKKPAPLNTQHLNGDRMHLLIKDVNGAYRVRKKSAIRDIYQDANKKTIVCFEGAKNTPIRVEETPEDFFNIYLAK